MSPRGMPRAKKTQGRVRIEPTRVDLVTIRKANVMSVIATRQPLWSVKPEEVEMYVRVYNHFIEGALGGEKIKDRQVYVLTPQDFESVETSNLTDVLPEFMEYLKRHAMPWRDSIKTSNIFEVPTAVVKLAGALDMVMGVKIRGKRYTVVLEMDEAFNLHYSAERLKKMADINRELRQFFRQRLVEDLGYTGLYMAAVSLFSKALRGEGRWGEEKAAFVVYSGKSGGGKTKKSRLPTQDIWWPNITPMVALPWQYAEFYLSIARAGSDYAKPVAEALLRYIRTGDLVELYSIIRNMTQTKRLTQAEREALKGLLEHIS